MRGGAESGAVRGAVHVRNIRADGEMHGDGDAEFVGGSQDAGACVGYIDHGVVEKLSGGLAVAKPCPHCHFRDLVQIFARFRGHAECTGSQTGFDIFGSVANQRDFEIVDEGGAVHGERGDEAAAHEVDEDGTEANLDDVAADAPENGFALLAGLVNGGEEIAEVGSG